MRGGSSEIETKQKTGKGQRERGEKANKRRKHKNKRDRFSVALYATKERSPEDEKLYARQNRGGKTKIKK